MEVAGQPPAASALLSELWVLSDHNHIGDASCNHPDEPFPSSSPTEIMAGYKMIYSPKALGCVVICYTALDSWNSGSGQVRIRQEKKWRDSNVTANHLRKEMFACLSWTFN